MRQLPRRILCLVAGGQPPSGRSLTEAVGDAVAGGVNLVQLREPGMPASRLLELASSLRAVCADRALLFVNDRVDVALACRADGVQLGENGMPVASARAVAGQQLLIGRSVHSVEGAELAAAADLLVVGTIYESASHPGVSGAGPELISKVARASTVPILGIGGITAQNAGTVVAAGAVGVAVIGAILGSSDPHKAASDLRRAIETN